MTITQDCAIAHFAAMGIVLCITLPKCEHLCCKLNVFIKRLWKVVVSFDVILNRYMKIVYSYCQCMHVVNVELFPLLFHWICSLLKNVRLSFRKWSNNTCLPRKLKDTSTHQRASMYHHSFSVIPPLNTLKLWHFRNSFFWHGVVSQYLFTQKVENLHLEIILLFTHVMSFSLGNETKVRAFPLGWRTL